MNRKLSKRMPSARLQRFDKPRATLALLLLSAAVLALSAVQQTHLLRGYQDGGRVRSVWEGHRQGELK